MSVTAGETIYGRGVMEGRNEGRVEGRVEGQLLTLRSVLTVLLTKQFGTLPEEIKQRIEAATDPHLLERAVLQVIELKSLDELSL